MGWSTIKLSKALISSLDATSTVPVDIWRFHRDHYVTILVRLWPHGRRKLVILVLIYSVLVYGLVSDNLWDFPSARASVGSSFQVISRETLS
jgi:hypothetical protein